MRTTKNYKENGGDTWNIGGDLNLVDGGRLLQDGKPLEFGSNEPPTGTATQLKSGKDTTQRTFSAKDIHEEIARQISLAISSGA